MLQLGPANNGAWRKLEISKKGKLVEPYEEFELEAMQLLLDGLPDSLSDGVDEELRLCGFEDGDPEPSEDPPSPGDQQLCDANDDVTRLPAAK